MPVAGLPEQVQQTTQQLVGALSALALSTAIHRELASNATAIAFPAIGRHVVELERVATDVALARLGESSEDDRHLRTVAASFLANLREIAGRALGAPNPAGRSGALELLEELETEADRQVQTAFAGITRDRVAGAWNGLASAHQLADRIGLLARVIAPLVVALTLATLWLTRRILIQPMLDLQRVVNRYRAGDLSARAQRVASDEVGSLARAFNDLAEELERRGRENADAVARAEAANEAKGRFLAHVSHELRTPLNGVIGMGDLLGHTTLSESQRHLLSMLMRSGELLTSLIDNLLDFAKIEAGKLELERAPLRLGPVLQEVIELQNPRASEKGLLLSLETTGLPDGVHLGDPLRVRQILINLIANAIRFTEEGSIRVRAGAVRADADRTRFRLEVADTGVGIPAERRAALFQPFEQADASTARKFGGTGLGLSIVRELAALMGGSVAVDSAVGVGSCFRVEFELERATGAEALLPETAARGSNLAETRFRARVLAADDVAINREVARGMLEAVGCSVDVVANGEEAVLRVESGDYDLVLLDCQMPVMDGFKAALRIREWLGSDSSRSGKRLPILACTAALTDRERARVFEAGMDDLLEKPFRREALVAALARWLAPELVSGKLRANSAESSAPTEAAAPRSAAEPAPTELPTPIDAQQIESLRRVDPDLVRRVLGAFLDELPQRIAALRAARSAQSAADAARAAHALKSASGNVGALELHRQLAEFEVTTRNDAPGWEQRMDPLLAEIERARVAIAALVAAESTA
jgi:signal transduction histidine kinase/DNA-binding NarL/FixJ family response regulator